MTVRIIGGGWYGSHLCLALSKRGIDVVLHESADRLFNGASGGNPARLHQGFHYPRSRLTRAACLDHADAFMRAYGHLTRAVPINLYAVAARDSLVDFGTFRQVLAGEVPFIPVNPVEFGLQDCEGAVLTGERHVVVDQARAYFEAVLSGRVEFCRPAACVDDPQFAMTIDCTFCALDAEAIDRYEPCLTVLLKGPTDKAVTIMDGPFPSIYPWREDLGLLSLTSASLTPLSKTCRSYREARAMLDAVSPEEIADRSVLMLRQMRQFWPAAGDLFDVADMRLTVRAMPRSGADARLVDLVRIGERAVRVRAGKIDAVFRAEELVMEVLCGLGTR